MVVSIVVSHVDDHSQLMGHSVVHRLDAPATVAMIRA